MSPIIIAENLSKSFTIRNIYPGILGAMKGIFSPKRREKIGVKELSFSIQSGERVAFIGPNGAGKSTTIKMLTGILYPSTGCIKVLGLDPWKNRHILGYKIGTVFGQRTQLWPHLPTADTFFLLSKIYELEDALYKVRLKKLVELFDIGPFLNIPVRQLSLGQKMRCELIASLLHNPEILFLDEPTIGLDLTAKMTIRRLLNHLSKDQGTTLFLTSHDTADVEQVCDRVIILDQGAIILDSSVKELKRAYVKKKILSLTTGSERIVLDFPGVTILKNEHHHFICEVGIEEMLIDRVLSAILKQTTLKDLTVEDPSMEEIIRTLYTKFLV